MHGLGLHDGVEEVIPLSNTATLSPYKLVLLVLIRKYLEGEITGARFSLFLIAEVKVQHKAPHAYLISSSEIGQRIESTMRYAAKHVRALH